MGVATIDTEKLKRQADCRDILGARVELRKETAGGREVSAPCPKCGGEDRCHATADWFFCRECHTKRGDAIELVQWLGLAHDFHAACEYLGGPALQLSANMPKRAPEKAADAHDWQSSEWQSAAREELTRAQACLVSATGTPGQDYLVSRGLVRATWSAWGLGYTPEKWDPKSQRRRPAIVIPWQRTRITALKYRFIDENPGGLRYISRAGGESIAFGLNLAGQHYGQLWLTEGEINAMMLWQTLELWHWRGEGHRVNWDVISYGSEGRAVSPVILKHARRYQQVIVWADRPDVASQAMREIPGAFGLRSPEVDGHKLDAAELGRQGLLHDFMAAAEVRFNATPAYLERLQRESSELSGGTNGD